MWDTPVGTTRSFILGMQVQERREARERRKQAEAEVEAREEARLQAFHAQQLARFRSVSTASPPADMGRRRALPKACSPAQALTEPVQPGGSETTSERGPVSCSAHSNDEVRLARLRATANPVQGTWMPFAALGS